MRGLLAWVLVLVSLAAVSAPAGAATIRIEVTGHAIMSFSDYVGPDGYIPGRRTSVNDPALDGLSGIESLRSGRGALTISPGTSPFATSPMHVSSCSGFFIYSCQNEVYETRFPTSDPNGPPDGYWLQATASSVERLFQSGFTHENDWYESWTNALGSHAYVDMRYEVQFDSFSMTTTASPDLAPMPVPLPVAFLLTGLGALALLRRRALTASS